MLNKKTKLILSVIVAVISIMVIAIFAIVRSTEVGMKKLMDTSIQNIDLQKIPDGIYFGEHDSFPIEVIVEVQIKNHKIIAIDITKHSNGQGKPAEVIIDLVINKQALNVDSITGSTYSSKAILLAIENALVSKINE